MRSEGQDAMENRPNRRQIINTSVGAATILAVGAGGGLFASAGPASAAEKADKAHKAFSHDHVGITVTPEQLDATIEWYLSKLGFTVEQRFEAEGTTFVFIARGDVKIELVTGASKPHRPAPDSVFESMDPERLHHFCIAVNDLDAMVSQLRRRDVQVIDGPMDAPAIGRRIAFITDNLGNILEFAGPIRPAPRGNRPDRDGLLPPKASESSRRR
jgi:catechol 2,3-dioxygenase-like lactoylglutathione lyase family enzyme